MPVPEEHKEYWENEARKSNPRLWELKDKLAAAEQENERLTAKYEAELKTSKHNFEHAERLIEENEKLLDENERLQKRVSELDKLHESSHPEDNCQRCNGRNIKPWFAPNELWNKVAGDWRILCPQCFVERAKAVGIDPTGWEFTPEFYRADQAKKTAEEIILLAKETWLKANPRSATERALISFSDEIRRKFIDGTESGN